MSSAKGADGFFRYKGKYKGVQIDLRSKDKNELEQRVYERKRAIDDGTVVGSGAGTRVDAWAQVWLETYKKPNVSINNYKNYERNLRLHVLPAIGKFKISDIKPYQLQGILNDHAEDSSAHIGHIKNAITSLFASAYTNGLIPKDPSKGLIEPKGKEEGHRSLTDKETAQFLKTCKTHYAGTFFRIIFYCGLRPEEICALEPSDIDLKNGYVHVRKAVERGTRNVSEPKTEAGKRDVPIPDMLMDPLRVLVDECIAQQRRYLFSTKDGRPFDTDDSCRWWRFLRNAIDREAGAQIYRNKIVKHAFDPSLSAYDLRHTYCTNLQRAGVPINVAKYLMGHSSIEVTARIYTHQTADVTEDARAMMNKFHSEK